MTAWDGGAPHQLGRVPNGYGAVNDFHRWDAIANLPPSLLPSLQRIWRSWKNRLFMLSWKRSAFRYFLSTTAQMLFPPSYISLPQELVQANFRLPLQCSSSIWDLVGFLLTVFGGLAIMNPALLCHKGCFSGCFIPSNHGYPWILPPVPQGSATVRNNVIHAKTRHFLLAKHLRWLVNCHRSFKQNLSFCHRGL